MIELIICNCTNTQGARFYILFEILKEYLLNTRFFSSMFLKKILKEHLKNMQIFIYFLNFFLIFQNIFMFFECSSNIFLTNTQEKNPIFF